MNLYFVIPFLDYYSNVKVRINTLVDNIQIIQQQGAYIGQYFAFFKDMFASRMNLTPGMALMFTLIIAIIIWLNGNATKEIKILSVVSVFILFMASDLFPWNHIGLHYKWGKILSQVQFPWRYIGIAVMLLTMLLGCVCKLIRRDENHCRKFFILIIGSCLIAEIFYVSNYSNEARMLFCYDTAEVDTYALMGKEYLLNWTDINSLHGKVMQENMRLQMVRIGLFNFQYPVNLQATLK